MLPICILGDAARVQFQWFFCLHLNILIFTVARRLCLLIFYSSISFEGKVKRPAKPC